MNTPTRSPLRFALALLVALGCAAAGLRCGGGALDAPLPEGALDDAPWEAGYAPDEPTDTLRDVVWAPRGDLTDPAKQDRAAGVRVELLLPRPDGLPPLVKAAEATTAEDGSFELPGVPRGPYVLRTSKAGRASVLVGRRVRVRGPMEIVPEAERGIGSQPGRPLSVFVVDRAGRMVPGVAVDAMSFAYLETAVTDAGGKAEFFVPLGRVGVSVADPAWDPALTVAEPGEVHVELRTVATPVLDGEVVTAEDGRRIAGATVMWLEDPTKRATSDAEGRFVLPVPRRGRIAACADGRTWRSYDIPPVGGIELRLAAARTLAGTVRDAQGAPVEDARVWVVATNAPHPTDRAKGPRTRADGWFEMTWTPQPGATGRACVVAWHRRLGVSEVVELPSRGEIGPVDLRLSSFSNVTGTVVDAQGRPVPRVRVVARWTLPPLDPHETGILDLPTERVTGTDASGAFLLHDVREGGDVTVVASHFGFEMLRTLAPGAARDGVRFELARGGRIAGRITTRKGEPPGAPGRVTARLVDVPGVQYESEALAGPDGAFAFEDVPKGRYTLEASAEGYDYRNSRDAHPGDLDVTIAVEKAARPSLRVRAEDGGSLGDGELTALIEDAVESSIPPTRLRLPFEVRERAVPLGSFRPGRWRIRVEGAGWRGVSPDLEFDDGDAPDVEVTLGRTYGLRARVVNADGTPLAGENVVFIPVGPQVEGRDAQGRTPVTVQTTPDGRLEGVELAAGKWLVRVAPKFKGTVSREIEVPAREELELTLPPTGDLQVRVVADGRPVADAIVSLTDPEGAPVHAWSADSIQRLNRFRTDENGVARPRGVPVGKVRVTARVGAASPQKEVAVEAGRETSVTLE